MVGLYSKFKRNFIKKAKEKISATEIEDINVNFYKLQISPIYQMIRTSSIRLGLSPILSA